MPESLIESLEIQTYDKNPRQQEGTIGEKSTIREIDPTDRIDVRRVFDIDRQDAVKKFMVGEEKTEQESIDWASKQVHMFAVSGALENSSENEKGELQGWIWFANDEKERLERAQALGLMTPAEGAEALEASFAKLEGSAEKQMSSGLRQACTKVARIRVSEDDDKLMPDTVITAYARAENVASVRVLEASGFVNRGEIVYDPTDDPEPDILYVLDWEKLNNILHEKADQKLFPGPQDETKK